jgi:hypothetical protein
MKCQLLKIRPQCLTLTFYPTYIRGINLITDLQASKEEEKEGVGEKNPHSFFCAIIEKNCAESKK